MTKAPKIISRDEQAHGLRTIRKMIASGKYPLVKSDWRDRGRGFSRYTLQEHGVK